MHNGLGHGLEPRPQFHERKKKRNLGRENEKRDISGGPAEGGPVEGVPAVGVWATGSPGQGGGGGSGGGRYCPAEGGP